MICRDSFLNVGIVMFAARLIFTSLLLALVGCGQDLKIPESGLASHATQNWSVSGVSQPLSMVAESGACLTQLPSNSFASDYCLNAVPAARISVSSAAAGTMVAFCLATHLPGMASQAALMVVDAQGNLVSEVTSNGNMQMIDTFTRSGTFTVYVGFPTGVSNQRVTVRVAPLSKFAVSSPACNLF